MFNIKNLYNMKKPEINPYIIPKGIQYLTEWDGFTLPDHPCIIDKKLTGCGFTEYVIRGNFNAVLISPRKTLLENKVAQHNPKIPGTNIEDPYQRVIYYARTDEPDLGIDKDLMVSEPKVSTKEILSIDNYIDPITYKENLKEAIFLFKSNIINTKPIKICVTYDSFRKVREILEELNIANLFYYIVDEFQSIFTDSRFKPGTELEFVTELQKLQRVCFVSATPMMEKYLDDIDEFKMLPYYEMDWESKDNSRIIHPEIVAKPTRSINETAKKIITEFKEGKFHMKSLVDINGLPTKVIQSKELIFYVNSVKNIADIIRQNKLMPEDVNVICARTEENSKKIRESFRQVFRVENRSISELPNVKEIIGSVPTPDLITGIVINKPITLCTKTVYLGADFYSKCARSIVLSDANSECLAVDITLDLPQILGRQRDYDNPWKNSLEIFFKIGYGAGDITKEQFEKIIEDKIRRTNSLLRSYDKANDGEDKHNLAEGWLQLVKLNNYKTDYLSINRHCGSDLKPQKNNLVLIAERRAFDIQQQDYKDRVTVFNRVGEVFGDNISKELQDLNDKIDTYSRFPDKMTMICNWVLNKGEGYINYLPEPYRTYIQTLGIEYILSKGCRKYTLDEAMVKRGIGRIFSKEDLWEVVTEYFQIGQKYTKSQIKQDLQEIYTKLGIPDKATSLDLEKWFDIRSVKITNKESGKRDHGFEIIKLKQS